MHVFEREVNGCRYRIAAQSVWDPERRRSVARQVVLGPAAPPPVADLRATRTVGTRAVGDVGALIWVAEQLDLIGHIDRACGRLGAKGGPSVGELAVAVAIQRACAPGPKRDLGEFLDASVPRVSCLPGWRSAGKSFIALLSRSTDQQLEQAQVAIAKAGGDPVRAIDRRTRLRHHKLRHAYRHGDAGDVGPTGPRQEQATRPAGGRARRVGQRDGACPLLYRTYAGNGSDQGVLETCLNGLGELHEALDAGEGRRRPAQRTLVRDGGFWSPQLELDLTSPATTASSPCRSGTALRKHALEMAARRGAMKPLRASSATCARRGYGPRSASWTGRWWWWRARSCTGTEARHRSRPTQSQGGVAQARAPAQAGRIQRGSLEHRVKKALARGTSVELRGHEHRWRRESGDPAAGTWMRSCGGGWRAPGSGARVLLHGSAWLEHGPHRAGLSGAVECRGVVPSSEERRRGSWGPSYQWADGSLRLHTFATVLGLTLVSLAKIALGTTASARAMMESLGRHPCHTGAHDEREHGPSAHRHART